MISWGRVTNRAIDSVAQTVVYDALGRVTLVTNVLGSFTNNYLNTTFRLSSVAYPNGQITAFTYFGNSGASTVRSNGITGAILKRFVYGYDKAGNRMSEQIIGAPTESKA